ncbi:MarR family winged helix-turn-helix transcriptional regulator [Paenibacillus flagellatus]|uniref:MarR family transcriptional regulator n=1 Tax=Paenibacillus flagellatus TaxID=2211139 RepID=A0A2V5K0B9_9BACL|nr:MarR family transcriptional regulator [Paenibacillus flagellatus]PYI52531.1 MarR family transcriptional regulator [Paenibacillus flagellatus]
MDRDASSLPDSITHLMSKLLRQHHSNSHLLLKSNDVHPGQPPLLFLLARHDGLRQHELAERLRVKPATVTVMVNRLVKNGLVERRADPDDQRATRVYLTAKGRGAVDEVRGALQESEAHALEGVTPEERMELRRILLRMYDNVTRHERFISRHTKGAPDDGEMD